MHNAVLYLVTVLAWGTSWYGVKLQLGVVTPEVSVAYRFAIAALLLFGWCFRRGLRLRFRPGDHAAMALQGVLLFSFNYMLMYLGIDRLTSGLAAVAFSTIVIMNIAFGALLLGARIRPRAVAGAALGLAGIALVFWPEIAAFDLQSAALGGLAAVLLATAFTSLGNIASARNQLRGRPVVQSNAFGMAYATLATVVVVVLRDLPVTFDPGPVYVGSLLYLAVFASAIGFGTYLTLLGRIGADRVAYVTVLFPIVALAISTVLEGYGWTPLALVGVALVLLGNVIVLGPVFRT
jgi:drug/metabolite transporter (DMT)-like permease